jgi:hypothetical protein
MPSIASERSASIAEAAKAAEQAAAAEAAITAAGGAAELALATADITSETIIV